SRTSSERVAEATITSVQKTSVWLHVGVVRMPRSAGMACCDTVSPRAHYSPGRPASASLLQAAPARHGPDCGGAESVARKSMLGESPRLHFRHGCHPYARGRR